MTLNTNGPTEDKLVGLNIEERKQRRSGLDTNEFMDISGSHGLVHTDSVLSKVDFSEASPDILARLVNQASQTK